MTALLQLDRATLVRGERLLFEELDLSVEPGDRLQLAGPNGSGKSSLLRLAAGLLQPASGRVHRARLALVDDKPSLDPELTVERALNFWAAVAGTGKRVERAIEAIGLTQLAQVPVRLLSTGQRKRAALARAALSNAPLWLLDEPANGLDGDGLLRLTALIDEHVAEGGAVVAASHLPLGGSWKQLELGG